MSLPSEPSVLPPVTSIADAIARMEQISAALPPDDGLACFNRMYLQVTEEVGQQVTAGFFADPAFTSALDVTFANLYLDAADNVDSPGSVPLAWRPLTQARADKGIEPIQFALAGMNAHINHDLPIAVVQTCQELGTTPTSDAHLSDYQKIDRLLDAIEQSVRQSFENAAERAVDRHIQAVCNLIACWSITSARDVAWANCLLLWQVRNDPVAYQLVCDSLAAGANLASHLLLVAV
ncbi:MAG TPA: DUF5995 family protein [Streptosporangiaceae bacterium]|jgi:hypothetical protein|nr:DUF5995 family protein [Streptosporangiaceae bacterium]